MNKLIRTGIIAILTGTSLAVFIAWIILSNFINQ